MFNEFMSLSMLASFTSIVLVVTLLVQFTKSLVKDKFGDVAVRVYTLIISLILVFVFARTGNSLQDLILTVINAVIVAITSMGGYEIVTDYKAEKHK